MKVYILNRRTLAPLFRSQDLSLQREDWKSFLEKFTSSRDYTDTGLLSMKQLGPHLITLPGGPVVDSFAMDLSNDFLLLLLLLLCQFSRVRLCVTP